MAKYRDMRLHKELIDGYYYYTIQYLGWPSYNLKSFRLIDNIVCYDFFSRGELCKNDVPNGTRLSIDNCMLLQQGIIPNVFKQKEFTRVI